MRIPIPLVFTLWIGCVPLVYADNMDGAILGQAKKIRDYLRDHQYQNVGVLKFRVQKANAAPSWRIGPLNINLASRLENALVLINDPEKPLGIIHDADRVAQERHLPNYATDAGMEKLFQQKFPLAWGNQSVQADVFLTGLVRVAADLKQVTVSVHAFAPNASQLSPVVTFTVLIDRELLNDLGESFFLSSRSLNNKRTRALDIEAAEDAAVREKSQGESSVQTSEKLFDFEIRYDGKPQTVSPNPQEPGKFIVAEPQQGQKVTVFIRSLAQERIGVALMINGKNSLYEEEGEPRTGRKWILDPTGDDNTNEIMGFQVDENNTKPFRVLSPAESEAMQFTENLGLITFAVFRTSKDKPPDPDQKNVQKGDVPADTAMNFGRDLSLRNPPPHTTKRGRSLKEQQAVLVKQVPGWGKKGRGLIGAEDTLQTFQVYKVEFPNPEQQQLVVIRYYSVKGR